MDLNSFTKGLACSGLCLPQEASPVRFLYLFSYYLPELLSPDSLQCLKHTNFSTLESLHLLFLFFSFFSFLRNNFCLPFPHLSPLRLNLQDFFHHCIWTRSLTQLILYLSMPLDCSTALSLIFCYLFLLFLSLYTA